MLTIDEAEALSRAGIMWRPSPGDRFTIRAADLMGQVYWVSELTIELHHYGDQSVLGFNGTTEWALDSVTLDQALWLPREDQLRELLGDRLTAVHRGAGGWRVVIREGTRTREAVADDLESAYARALLALC